MSTTSLLKELVCHLSVQPAPPSTRRVGEWVEVMCAVGPNDTAYIAMPRETYDKLVSKHWG